MVTLVDFIKVAEVGGAHGQTGAVLLRILRGEAKYCDQFYDEDGQILAIRRLRYFQSHPLVNFYGINSKEQADKLKGASLFILKTGNERSKK